MVSYDVNKYVNWKKYIIYSRGCIFYQLFVKIVMNTLTRELTYKAHIFDDRTNDFYKCTFLQIYAPSEAARVPYVVLLLKEGNSFEYLYLGEEYIYFYTPDLIESIQWMDKNGQLEIEAQSANYTYYLSDPIFHK